MQKRAESQQHEPWDVAYEWRAVLLLMLAFGLVGLDRFAPNLLFPFMMKDLHLDYQDLGIISSVLALAWGVGSICMGRVSDRLGRRKVLIPSITVFSCVSGLTGLVNGLASLLLMRVIMGFAEGSFMPPSIAATIEASKPSRRGFNFGLQQNGLPTIGLGLGPIVSTQLLAITGSWRWTYVLIALPGLMLSYLMYRVIRDTRGTTGFVNSAPAPIERPSWSSAIRCPNVALACLVLVCLAGSLNVVIAMTPSYLVEYLKVDTQHMGYIMSAIGVGAFLGGITLPALSDRIGRKPVMLSCAVAATLALWLFMSAPAHPVRLFSLLTAATGFAFSVIFVNNGPLTVESVPASLSSTAVGLVVGLGEIVGGGIAPSTAGFIATKFGIQHVFAIAMGGFIACAVTIVFIREPNGAKIVSAKAPIC